MSIRRTVIIVLGIALFTYLTYWGIQMYQFAKGVEEDFQRKKLFVTENRIQDGDLIFQISLSNQSKAIQLATQSKYSHMGIIYEQNGQWYVYEAIATVRFTPLQDWIKRGKNKHFVIKRLKAANTILTVENLQAMKAVGETFKNKQYDLYFEWSDNRIYCSELVWKIYHEATGVEIGALQTLDKFDLTHRTVKNKMKERYGDQVPLSEVVISPAAMFHSNLLEEVDLLYPYSEEIQEYNTQ